MSRLTESDIAELTSRPKGPRLAKNHLSSKTRPRGANVAAKRSEAETQKRASRGFFVVSGSPVAKPRQTRSDKWRQRPCVMKYRDWADRARKEVGRISKIGRLDVVAYFSIPKHHCQAVRELMRGQPHESRPDADNILKACADAICKSDQSIHTMSVRKMWDDGNGPRVEICIY